MDGTPRWRSLWRITLPLLMPTMLVVMVLSVIRAVQAFDEIYVLTGGGPGSATTLLIQYIYDVGFCHAPAPVWAGSRGVADDGGRCCSC